VYSIEKNQEEANSMMMGMDQDFQAIPENQEEANSKHVFYTVLVFKCFANFV
jgi:hypothetical protein